MRLFGRKRSRARIDEVLRGHELPVLSQGTMTLMRLLRDPDTELEKIAEALSWDAGLVVRAMKVVNSAAFGSARTIDGVAHAVHMLGRTQLEQLVLGVVVKEGLPSGQARGFEAGRFWRGSFFRAALARTLSDRLHPADKARSFTGALLQDMAVPLLAHAREDDYGDVLEAYHRTPSARLHELEREQLGFSHDEIGAHLAGEWELPEPLRNVIGRHHDDSASDRELPPALRLVALYRESSPEYGVEVLVEDARSMYGLDADWTRTALADSQDKAVELERALR